MNNKSLALHTDFYQITMAATYHGHGMNGQATFSLFAHKLPSQRGFMVAAGLESALDYLESFAFSGQDLEYLRSLNRFTPKFLDFLAELRFRGDVWAIPEGTVFFAGEPILEVTAPIIEAQLVETYLINIMNLHSMLAGKAARCVMAAKGRICVDFSLRRTQGLEAGWAVARSSALVGFTGTSNVAASSQLGLNPVGTMAHSLVEAFGEEQKAFEAFSQTFPDHTVLLADTYDSLRGLERAVDQAVKLKNQGHKLVGVRLDSGDLVEMSQKARQMLDEAGLEKALVVVSGSLDEMTIAELLARGAQVDVFGIGTKMGCSADAPYLDLAYKLVSYNERPTLKLSSGKETWAGPKQLWRRLNAQGQMQNDLLGLREEKNEGQPLLEPVMEKGRRIGPSRDWRQARDRYQEQVAALPATCLHLQAPTPLEVEISLALKVTQDAARRAALNNLP